MEEEQKENTNKDTYNALTEPKNRERLNNFIKSLESGVSVLRACKTAGIDYATIWRWRKRYPEFDEQIKSIMDSRTQIVEDSLFINATRGNLGAQIFWLKNRSQGRWQDVQNIKVKGKLETGLSKEEEDEIIRLAFRAVKGDMPPEDKGKNKE